MSPLMQELQDIEGLDLISFWPLSMACWILIVCAVFMLGICVWVFIRYVIYLKSWKRDAFKRLDRLEKRLSSDSSTEILGFLSEYLRRIVIRRFPRKECAGLVGDAWLRWLKEHDPKQFDWAEKGKLLIEVPYAPEHSDLPPQQIKELIQAIRHWIH